MLTTCDISPPLLLRSGHTFTVTLNRRKWEYIYEPEETSLLPPDSKFASKFCFPDYMLGRFLTNLLNDTYRQER